MLDGAIIGISRVRPTWRTLASLPSALTGEFDR
jgi:hypothetical protein